MAQLFGHSLTFCREGSVGTWVTSTLASHTSTMFIIAKVLSQYYYETFLAAMSSSRSDDVTKSVCLCVCVSVVIFFSLEHSMHKKQDKSFNGVSG